MGEAYGLNESDRRKVAASLNTTRRLPRRVQGVVAPPVDVEAFPRAIEWKNYGGSTCPPGGIIKITDYEPNATDPSWQLKGYRPDAEQGNFYAVNGSSQVANGDTGQCLLYGHALAKLPDDIEQGDTVYATVDSWDAGSSGAFAIGEALGHTATLQVNDEDESAGLKPILLSVESSLISLVYLGDPESADPYVEPDSSGAYDARVVTIPSAGTVDFGDEPKKVWLLVGQRYDEFDNVQPLPRGLILLALKQGSHSVEIPPEGEEEEPTEDERPLYYADHWQWLWVKVDLSSDPAIADGATGNAIVLDKDGTETEIEVTIRNRTGKSISNASKVFVDQHAESGEWWIRSNGGGGSIRRAKVGPSLIDYNSAGNVYLWDDDTDDWSTDETEIENHGRPLFSEEEIVVGEDAGGLWQVLEVPQHLFDGTADEAIPKSGTGTVLLEVPDGVQGFLATSKLGSVAEGDKVIVAWFGTFFGILAAECTEE